MSKLGFADAVRADGDDWQVPLEISYWKKGMVKEGDAVLMSCGNSSDDDHEFYVMQKLVRASASKKI